MTSRRLAPLVLVLAACVTLAACANTARGVGRDTKNNVQATEKAVRGY
ncbi:hypothetical protein GCM10008171_11860 [Methylopila jiangsuensis]|uniref:Entericidin n=1 Tax=Methylopila jiangsuensis TaxID=586230 RepID=A0A9W6JES0_9HYPH|nr:putative small secreted protein [Methylopila jiangsuensis]GLK75932.1 hypothetical protein GCM10008171_11860 [Methylopila jiangsuensis]